MGRTLPPLSEVDPRGLIAEAYRIDGIGEAECRSIFLDWAIGVPQGRDAAALIPVLLAHHAGESADHPMNRVLREGLGTPEEPRRRGGRRGRAK